MCVLLRARMQQQAHVPAVRGMGSAYCMHTHVDSQQHLVVLLDVRVLPLMVLVHSPKALHAAATESNMFSAGPACST